MTIQRENCTQIYYMFLFKAKPRFIIKLRLPVHILKSITFERSVNIIIHLTVSKCTLQIELHKCEC